MLAFLAKLKDLAPYAALEIVMPGGSVLALLLWLYRRHRSGDGLRVAWRILPWLPRRFRLQITQPDALSET